MPSYTVPYASTRLYDRGPTRTIGDLLRLQQEQQANALERRAAIRAQGYGQVGNAIAGTIGSILQAREEAPIRAAEIAQRQAQAENMRAEAQARQEQVGARQQGTVQDRAWTAFQEANPEAPAEVLQRQALRIFGPERGAKIAGDLEALKPAAQRPMGAHVVDGALVNDTGAVLYQAPAKAVEPKAVTYGSPTPVMVGGTRTLVRAGSDGQLYDMRNHLITADVAPDAPPTTRADEPLVPIMGPDNQPVLVPRSQAVGRRPANTREQGRPVTSGDAGRLADFDTSLNDLKTLRSTLTETKDATGTGAQIGAAVPAWATNLTGWGTDAKKRQGVIDRVKQVIGKTLEGGVLRKEDEYKYEKILPTIKDSPEIAASKLNGLDAAIAQRKQTTLDALEDANYDVNKYRARGGAPKVDPLGIR